MHDPGTPGTLQTCILIRCAHNGPDQQTTSDSKLPQPHSFPEDRANEPGEKTMPCLAKQLSRAFSVSDPVKAGVSFVCDSFAPSSRCAQTGTLAIACQPARTEAWSLSVQMNPRHRSWYMIHVSLKAQTPELPRSTRIYPDRLHVVPSYASLLTPLTLALQVIPENDRPPIASALAQRQRVSRCLVLRARITAEMQAIRRGKFESH